MFLGLGPREINGNIFIDLEFVYTEMNSRILIPD